MRKSFKGTMKSGAQEQIHLSTIKGKVGYKIVKFAIMGRTPGANSQECIVKVFNQLQSAIDGVVEFVYSDLLAAAIWFNKSTIDYPVSEQVIFDLEVFNQDIFVTAIDLEDAASVNYYLELEVIPLTDEGAEYTTIKDIRSN